MISCLEQKIDPFAFDHLNAHKDAKQSVHAFLRSQGFKDEEIKALKKHNKQRKQEMEKQSMEPINKEKEQEETVQWFGELLSTEMARVNKIEKSATQEGHCYFYLDEVSLKEQKCPIETFKQVPKQFCAQENEQGIKDVKGKYYIEIEIGDQLEQVELTDELKTKKGPARVLCFRRLAENGRDMLLIGCVYIPDIHKKNHLKNLKSRIIKLHLPHKKGEKQQPTFKK